MDTAQRIAQFENMVRPGADPDNDMAWFSLAGAYAEAGRHADAARAYERCIQLNPGFSKAYQLAGAALIKAGDEPAAARTLEKGYLTAASRGDRMPQKAIADLLTQLGRPLPEVPAGATSGGPGSAAGIATGGPDSATGGSSPEGAPARAGAGATATPNQFTCRRSGRPGTKMPRPPFRGPIGEWIAANISRETFDEWIRQGTKVINEMRLDLSRQEDEDTYDAHMREYLGIDEELYAKLTEGKQGTAGE